MNIEINSKAQELLRTLKCPKCTYIAKNGKDLYRHLSQEHNLTRLEIYNEYAIDKESQTQICLCCGKLYTIPWNTYRHRHKTWPYWIACCTSCRAQLRNIESGDKLNTYKAHSKAYATRIAKGDLSIQKFKIVSQGKDSPGPH